MFLSDRPPSRQRGKALCRHLGVEPTRSNVHFGGPEDVVPLPSVSRGHSEESTRSSFQLRGPESFTHQMLLDQIAERNRRRPRAGLRNLETMHVDVVERRTHKYAPAPVRGGFEITDEYDVETLEVGSYRDIHGRIKSRSNHAGKAVRSVVGESIVWEHPGGKEGTPPPTERVHKRMFESHANRQTAVKDILFPDYHKVHEPVRHNPMKRLDEPLAMVDHLGSRGNRAAPEAMAPQSYIDVPTRRHYADDHVSPDNVVLAGDVPDSQYPHHIPSYIPPFQDPSGGARNIQPPQAHGTQYQHPSQLKPPPYSYSNYHAAYQQPSKQAYSYQEAYQPPYAGANGLQVHGGKQNPNPSQWSNPYINAEYDFSSRGSDATKKQTWRQLEIARDGKLVDPGRTSAPAWNAVSRSEYSRP